VCLTGGEALLIKDTPEIIHHGSELGHLVELLTHGYWSDQSRLEAAVAARPWRVTVSLDGVGDVHSMVRARTGFFERTLRSLETVMRSRSATGAPRSILLKTVVMRQNLDELAKVARFAKENDLEVFYQPIEQNYNTEEDTEWYLHSSNWPKDGERAASAVKELIELKQRGFPISNSYAQLEVMVPYFRDPARSRVATQSHVAHEQRRQCSALGLIQVQSNGDVRVCASAPPVGNIKNDSLRKIWESRPRWWEGGCCLERRLTEVEKRGLETQPRSGLSGSTS
jgi:MoaA/NifB/PqqE/SkfB family radical SAM enzyme